MYCHGFDDEVSVGPILQVFSLTTSRSSSTHKVAASGTVFVGSRAAAQCLQDLTHYLGHFLHQQSGLAYNGVKPSVEALTQDFGQEDKEQKLPSINRECGKQPMIQS